MPELSVEIDSTIPQTPSTASGTTDILKYRTRVVAYNTYNPRWNDTLSLRFDTYNSMLDLCFLRIEVKNQISASEDVTVAHFCASLGSLELGELNNSLPNATLPADNHVSKVYAISRYSTDRCHSSCTPRCWCNLEYCRREYSNSPCKYSARELPS